ncbi:MAG: amidohydrolase family protein [Nitrospinae bacterium]|nr:amidohydrolase family protein [Nitrospinota bacterium]
MAKTLIKNASVLSIDPEVREIEGGDVLIEGERISAVGENLADTDAETIDAAGMILLPGLINAHMHTWQTALRGMGGDWGGRSYFEIAHETLAPRYRPEDVYIATLVGAWAQIDAGATTLFDWCHNNPTPGHTDAGLDALEEFGIRALFGHGTPKPKPREGEPHYSQIPHPVSEIKRLRTGRLASDEGRITLAMAILGADYSPLEVALHDMRLAREYGLLSSAHIWGDASRKVEGGYHTLAKEGVLGPDHNLVHCNYVDDEELKVIIDSGASITATPSAEMQTNRGEAVCGRVSALGGRPSIGVDLETYVSGNMLHAMRHALQVQRIFDNRRLDENTYRAPALSYSARDALAWATINNAHAMGMADRIGSITPGKQADIILIRKDDLNTAPAGDPARAVVFYAERSNVDTVFIAGKKAKAGGKLLVNSDKIAKAKAELAESARWITGAV